MVNKLNEGGQSIKMLSYLDSKLSFSFRIFFNKNALLASFAVSTSSPDKFTFEPMISRFSTSVF